MVVVGRRPQKRRRSGVPVVRAGPRRPLPALPRGLKGYARIGGFYGRFSGAGAEWKFHDLDVNDAVVAVAGTIAQVSCLTIKEGNGESDRIGRKLTVRSVQWRYKLTLPNLTGNLASLPDTVRVILYLDKQTNGATATAALILQTDDYQSFYNMANQSRFRILCDKTHTLKAAASGAGDGTVNDFSMTQQNYQFSMRLNIPIEYDSSANTGVITSMRTNNIGVLLVGSDGKAVFESKMRFRYSDQ